MELTKCHGCHSVADGDAIQAEDVMFHLKCFVCTECKEPLDEYFLDEEKQFYCRKDFMHRFAYV